MLCLNFPEGSHLLLCCSHKPRKFQSVAPALERKEIDKAPLREAKLPIIWVLGEYIVTSPKKKKEMTFKENNTEE